MKTSKILSFESCYKNNYCVFRTPLNSIAGLTVLGISLPSLAGFMLNAGIDGIIIGALFSMMLSGYYLRKKASIWSTFSSLLLLTNIGLSLALVIMALAYKYIGFLGDGSNIASGLIANGMVIVGVYGIYFFKNYRLAPHVSVVGIMAICTILTTASIIFFDLHDFKWGQLYLGEQEGIFTGVAVSLVLLVVFWLKSRKTDSITGTSLTLNCIGLYLLLLAWTIFRTSSAGSVEHSQFISVFQVVLLIVCTIGGIYLLMRFKPWGSLASLAIVFWIGSGAISFLVISLITFQLLLGYHSAHFPTLGPCFLLVTHIMIIVTVIYVVANRRHIFNSIIAAFHIIWKKLSCFPIASFISTSYRIVLFLVINIIYLAYSFYPIAFTCNLSQSRILGLLADYSLYKVDPCRFVHTTLRDTYFGYDKVPRIYLAGYSSPELLLEKMKYQKMDKWSCLAINKNKPENFSEIYKLGLGLLLEHDKKHNIWVSFVHDDSSADKAGIKRGFKVLSIAGYTIEEIRENDLWDLFDSGENDNPLEMGFEDLNGNILETTLSWKWFKNSTVYHNCYFNLNGKIVGYLFFESFGGTSFEELSSVFNEYKKKAIDELVLDLRYNSGGLLDASRYLASLVAGKEAEGQVFQSLIYNDKHKDNNHSVYFSKEKDALNLKRVVVITTDSTCSASEALINGLKPFIDVVQVGSTTCGKPMGTDPIEFEEMEINVINFLVVNAEGEGGYYDGLKPTYPAEDDLMKPLGDPNEASLKEALHYLEYGA
jgi:carboxyl-terminal processing protease